MGLVTTAKRNLKHLRMEVPPQILTNLGTLFVALILILLSAELFTNGIEWLGHRMQLSEGVVGSVLAAVGTALPETLIPIVAVVFGTGEDFHQVGIGAIAGAPFMLSTLTFGVCGLAVMLFARSGARSPDLKLNKVVISRDLGFFIFAYGVSLLATFASPMLWLRQIIACLLILIYGIYLKATFEHAGEAGTAPEHLHFERLGTGTGMMPIIFQILTGLAGILVGAHFFVDNTRELSLAFSIPPVILSMIIAPIATELPEKFNSVLWAKAGKDTLAIGNISGALVFQSCFPVAFGVAFTSWNLGLGTIVSGLVAIISSTIILFLLKTDRLKPIHLVIGGASYALTVGWLLIWHLTD